MAGLVTWLVWMVIGFICCLVGWAVVERHYSEQSSPKDDHKRLCDSKRLWVLLNRWRAMRALNASIKQWTRNRNVRRPQDIKIGTEHCALCKLYFRRNRGDRACAGCPIKTYTGRGFCQKTPYQAARNAKEDWAESQSWAESLINPRSPDARNTMYKLLWQDRCTEEIEFLKKVKKTFIRGDEAVPSSSSASTAKPDRQTNNTTDNYENPI